MKRFILIFLFALATPAAEETPNAFLQFVKKRATALRAMERTPETLAEWQAMDPTVNDVGSTYKNVPVRTQAAEIIAAARKLLSLPAEA